MPIVELAQLRWQCRRGMLELDLLLMPFVENQYLKLAPSDQILLVELLSCSDQELFAWLVQQQESPAKWADLIAAIRGYASSLS